MDSISVIIPVFNRANLIGETLRSLMNQTVPAKEIIVVDDGSTDGTAEAVESEFSVFREQFSGNSKLQIPTLKIIRQANAGPGAARNRGLAEATGEFIHFFDSDDIAAPNKHELQLKALLETGADIAYGPWVKGRFGNLTTEDTENTEGESGPRLADQAGAAFSNPSTSELARDSENTPLNRSAMKPADRLSSFRFQLSGFSPEGLVLQARGLPEGDLLKALLTNWSVVPHACLFRRSILDKAGGFPEDIWVGEDQLLFLRCLLAGAKVVHTPGTMVFYRLGDEGKLTESKEGQRRRVVDWGRFLLKANEEATSESRRVPAEAQGRQVAEILTTEDTERTEDQFVQKQGGAWASQAGASESDSLASKLAGSPVSESLTPSASIPASSPVTRYSLLVTTTPLAWFGFRLRAYEAWRDVQAVFPGEYLELESGLEKVWKRSKFSVFSFQFSGFLLRKWGGLKQRFVGHRWSRAFRCGKMAFKPQNF